MTAFEEPLDGPRPFKPWVKIVGSVAIVALVCAVLFGISRIGLFSQTAAAPVRAVKAPVDTSGFSYPPEAQPAAFHPANTEAVRAAASPVAKPVARQSVQEPQTRPVGDGIIGLGGDSAPAARAADAAAHPVATGDGESTDDPLSVSLRAAKLDAAKAYDLGDQNYKVLQGRFISCTQANASSNEHPGAVIATVNEVVKSESGNVDLLDKGSKLFGVSQHAIANGEDTQFVLWQSVTSAQILDRHGIPHRYRVQVNSGATDDSGVTGLPGSLERHYGRKAIALIGISLMQAVPAAAGALASGSNHGGGTSLNFIQNGAQGVQGAADSWLNRILSQPDTLRRLQGAGCGFILMRDLDFSDVVRVTSR